MTSHSSYWLDDTMFDDTDVVVDDRPDLTRVTRLAAVRRAITNFVTILTNRNDLSVQYSSGRQSYATKNEIVLSATDDPEKFDYQVGLALHEASHILLTDFDYLEHWALKMNPYRYGADWNYNIRAPEATMHQSDIAQCVFHPELKALLPTMPENFVFSNAEHTQMAEQYSRAVETIFGYIKILMNILEDRRIDAYVYQRAGGYRPYYTALYNEDTLTKDIGKNLKYNPEWREPTVDNYINRLLLSVHPDATPDALPGLDILYSLMNLSTIDRVAPELVSTKNAVSWITATYEAQPRLYKDASELLAVIFRFAALHVMEKAQGDANTPMVIKLGSGEGLPNLDVASVMQATGPVDGESDVDFSQRSPDSPPMTKGGVPKKIAFNSKKGERDVEKFKAQTNGQVTKKSIKKREKEAIDSLDSARAEMVQLGGNFKGGVAMVTRKLTKSMLEQQWFVFGGSWKSHHNNALVKGRRMGQILLQRLEVRNDPVLTKTTRLPHGAMDRRLLAQLGMDITSVFSKTRIDTYKPAMLHLSIDGSGSMNGGKWNQVMMVATALAYVASKSPNIDVVISLRGGQDVPLVSVVFDSRVDKFTHWTTFAPHLHSGGATPEGLCYEATMKLMLENTSTHQVYLINFSDGQPAFHLNLRGLGGAQTKRYNWRNPQNNDHSVEYYGEAAFRHTREQIRTLKDAGVQILSYFIGNSQYDQNNMGAFRKMYGDSAEFVDVTNATMVLKTLNKLLLQRGT
jgi:hypothetical protein